MRRTSVKALAILGCCGFALAAAWPREAAAQPATPRAACADPGALGVSRTIALDTAGGLHVGLKTYPQTLALADKEVVLTFDDGPLPGPTDRTLDALKAECVKATFFLIGRNAQAYPQLVRRAVAEGHTIGHHSMSHPASTLRGLPPEAAIAEIEKGVAADQRASHGSDWVGGRPAVPFFRFPGFADAKASLAWLDAHDIATFGADVWASDWAPMTPQAQLELTMQRLRKSRGGIVLFHDTRGQTAAMMPEFLRRLKEEGFRVVHLVPGAQKPDLRRAPAGWRSETEAILEQVMPRLMDGSPATAHAPTVSTTH